MPLVKTLHCKEHTTILVWKITEDYQTLLEQVSLKETSQTRLLSMKSQLHQRAFLSVRMLLKEKGYSDFDLYYDPFGKPQLTDGNHISISHSHEFSTVIFSNQNVGIDIELQREKISKIADKFILAEANFLKNATQADYVRKLTAIWGVKEAIFKIRNEVGISFKDHIKVAPFEMHEKSGIATLCFQNKEHDFEFHFEEIESFTLVYAFQQSSKFLK